MHHGVEQRFAQGGQWVGKALFALDAAVKLKRHTDVRDDEFHRLLDHFKQGVGELAVVNDQAGRFEAADVDVVPQGLLRKQQHGGPGGLAVFEVVELFQCGVGVGFVQFKTSVLVNEPNEAADFFCRELLCSVTLRLVGVPRELQRLHVKVGDFTRVQRVIRAGDAFVITAARVDRLDRVFGNADLDDGFAVKAVGLDVGDQDRTGGVFDFAQPFVEAFFAKRGSLHGTTVGHAHQHAPALGVGKSHQGFDAGFVKRGFEFLRLGFTRLDPLLDGGLWHVLRVTGAPLRLHLWGLT